MRIDLYSLIDAVTDAYVPLVMEAILWFTPYRSEPVELTFDRG